MKQTPVGAGRPCDETFKQEAVQDWLFILMRKCFLWSLRTRPRLAGLVLGIIAALGLAGRAGAALPSIDISETNVTVIQTGGIDPLITRSWDLQLDTFPSAPWLSFSFVFATEEIPREGQVFDAASFFIQDFGQIKVTVLATVDGNGVVWLPPTEGTVPIPVSDLTREVMDLPSLQPAFPIGNSYFVTVRLPEQYYPERVRFVFQMFDYPNGLNSVGIVTAPQLYLVPEPTCLGISLLALSAFGLRRLISKPATHARPKT